MKVITVEYVDYGVRGEYGMFGKIVARSDVRGKTADEIAREVRYMRGILGEHVSAVYVEEVGALGTKSGRGLIADMERDGLL